MATAPTDRAGWRASAIASTAALALLVAGVAVADPVPEPDGYRMDTFRAPVPETVAGAHAIGTEAAHALWLAGVPFLDVMPRNEKPANLPADTLWIDKPRRSIAGALWVPNVGYGAIHETRHVFFRDALAVATAGALDAPVVLFCQAACWMSWNAAKRAAGEYGYTRIFWYPEGADGWEEAALPMETIPVFGD